MLQGYKTSSRHISWLYLFLGGFLCGVFVLNIWRDFFLGEMELLNVASLSRLRYMQVDGSTFFIYVLQERLGTAVLLSLLATTYIGTVALSVYSLYMGTLAGIVLSVASIRYGIRGILLILVSVLPQYLLLVPACIMLMGWCWRLNNALYHPGRHYDGGYGTPKQLLFRKIVQLLVIIGIIFVGSIVESYINPMLLSAFLKLF